MACWLHFFIIYYYHLPLPFICFLNKSQLYLFSLRRGYNIGTRLVDEFLAKSNVSRCVDFKETADVIAKVFR